MSRSNFYALLGLEPGATADEIEQAFRGLNELYRDDSLATYSLIDTAEARQIRAQLREAYDVLRDPLRRLEYDVRHGWIPTSEGERASAHAALAPPADPLEPEVASQPQPDAAERPRPERVDLAVLEEPVTGAALRAFREARGVSLRDIAQSTKISLRYLEYIESDRFDGLPAPVYLRGFVQEYARAAGLESRKTAESYLAYVSQRRGLPRVG